MTKGDLPSPTSSTKRRGRPSVPIEQRFWNLVARRSPSECWEWTGSGYGDGYGGFMIVGRGCVGAHRVAYELTYGDPPKGIFILHRCDNRRCCNPAHLFLGDHQANMDDMSEKNRSTARLQHAEVLAIRALHNLYGWKPSKLAEKFNVNPGTIYAILKRETYKRAGTDLTKRFIEAKPKNLRHNSPPPPSATNAE